jgi:hypothetical protein
MQNSDAVRVQVLFFSWYTSKLMVMLIIAVLAFIAGFLAGRPRSTRLSSDYGHGYDETNPNAQRSNIGNKQNTLSDEDKDYISED